MSGRGAIGSVLALGARGCEFESRRPDHSFIFTTLNWYILKKNSLLLNDYKKIKEFYVFNIKLFFIETIYFGAANFKIDSLNFLK